MATQTQEAAKIDQLAACECRTRSRSPPAATANSLRAGFRRLRVMQEMREALEKAFDYRGDITVTRKDGSKIEGYLFDRRTGATLADSLHPHHSDEGDGEGEHRVYSTLRRLSFTGRDTAAGKTFEAWVKKYWEKKAAGEKDIQIEPEKLD